MTKRLTTTLLGVFVGALVVYTLSRDFLLFLGLGRSLWWFALELLVLASLFASCFLLDRLLPKPDLETVTGIRALAGAVIVLAVLAPAVVAGAYLDELLGLFLSFGGVLVYVSAVIALRLVGARLVPSASTTSGTGTSSEPVGMTSASTPPN